MFKIFRMGWQTRAPRRSDAVVQVPRPSAVEFPLLGEMPAFCSSQAFN